ncbi:alpha/beta family hydrolase [Rhodovulum sp. YNF3179]|uniref:alpha/beta family hydrolase n=1 Tax=Rhodovulum sp. YNF3179 TaxID=3425127 RepID=UPI003D340E63
MDFLFDGNGRVTVLLAHGAGAPMDTPFMETVASEIASAGFRVARFEFDYMARRRTGGAKRPPPRLGILCAEYRDAIRDLAAEGPLIIGGKSMGGRVASLVADEFHASRAILGLFCLGFPFHPQGKPETLRTAHLEHLETPTLICQGTRDPFGSRDEVAVYPLSDRIEIFWLEDGDHDLKPRRHLVGASQAQYLRDAAEKLAGWTERLILPA